jgi:hypothetical protein
LAKNEDIDIKRLNKLVQKGGIPDELKGIRPIIWRVFLNYLPDKNTAQWEEHLRMQKESYDIFKNELIITPKLGSGEQKKKKIIDHPLSNNNNSEWKKFYADQELWIEIEKDVKRTRQDFAFFHMAIDPTKNDQIDRLMRQA